MNTQKTLLLVSDNLQYKNLLEDISTELAVQVKVCSTEQSVQEQVNLCQPLLVLLDEDHLSELQTLSDPLVLLLTDTSDSHQLSDFIDNGVAEFLFTPLQKPQVLQSIKRQLALLAQDEMSQRYIRQTLKLQELGELVGLVSHEVASPLGNVNTAVSFLLESSEKVRMSFDDKKLAANDLDKFLKQTHKALTMCVKNGGNAGGIINSFRNVATNQCLESLNQFYLHRYVDDIILTLKSKLKKLPHEIHVVIGESVEMTSYSGAFSQVLTGLINKSIVHGFDDRTPGKVIINASLQADDANGDKIVLNYMDNGKGMNEPTLNGLLSKQTDTVNNGLTTAMLKQIVEDQLQGTMTVASTEGEGVHYTLILPRRLNTTP